MAFSNLLYLPQRLGLQTDSLPPPLFFHLFPSPSDPVYARSNVLPLAYHSPARGQLPLNLIHADRDTASTWTGPPPPPPPPLFSKRGLTTPGNSSRPEVRI